MKKNCTKKELQPGMITIEDVKTPSGQVIVKKDTLLTAQIISRIGFYRIDDILVEVPEVSEPKLQESVMQQKEPVSQPKQQSTAPSYSQKVVRSKEFQTFQIDYTKLLVDIRNNFEGYVFRGQPLNMDALLAGVNDLYHSRKTSLELFDMLHNMRSNNDSVHAHCLNVALISRRIGRWLKIEGADLDVLTLAGLLHDIGKLKIPAEILNKPGKYTDGEFALVKQHTQFSYDLLKDLPLDERIKKAALSHHERCDGHGYPSGLSQDEIEDFTQIVAIADVYDAMTAARAYRAPLCPFQVIDNFEKDGLSLYRPKLILTFLKHIANTYQNNRILLSDGRPAEIVMLNDKYLSKPLVRLLDGTCIDLAVTPSLHIQSLV